MKSLPASCLPRHSSIPGQRSLPASCLPRHSSIPGQRRQAGVAFILVLWLLALLTILLGSFALITRTEALQARHLFDTTQARYSAEAGINRAVWQMATPDPQVRWVPDGRPYEFEFEGAALKVEVTDESGLIDLNAADTLTLSNLFLSQGVEQPQADALADAILDWRDTDDLVSPNGAEDADYEAEGYDYGAKDAPFDTVSEVQQVMGMTLELFAKVAPALTIYSGQPTPNPAFAPQEVLRSLIGMNDALAEQVIAARHAWDPMSGLPPPLLPDGTPLMAQGGSGTYSIAARATLPNGAWTELEATVRLGGAGMSGLAYTVLRWQDAETL
jgi:general secretion pathway protein K